MQFVLDNLFGISSGLAVLIMSGMVWWIKSSYNKRFAEKDARFKSQIEGLNENIRLRKELADAQANPLSDAASANDIVRRRRTTRPPQ